MKSRVKSSNKTYESRWKVYERFALSRNFDPFESSSAQVAECLIFLAEEKKVFWGTLAGYRSALGHVLRLVSGCDPGSCEILTQLLKSFKRTQPISARRVSESCIISIIRGESEERKFIITSVDGKSSVLDCISISRKTVSYCGSEVSTSLL